MKAFLRVTGWILLFGSLTFGAWLAWPLVVPPQQPGLLSRLAKADSALLQGQLDKAKAALQPWPDSPSAGQWLQWEKRIRAVVLLNKDWKWALEAATKATTQYPGNSDLAAFRVWVLLKTGASVEARDTAEKVLAHTRWEPLLVQARVEASILDKQAFPAGWSSLRQSLESPGAADPELYAKLTGLDSDPTLKKNALLSALAAGRLDVAQTYLSALTPSERDKPPFDRLQALLAYDQEDWVRSAALLRNLASSDSYTHQILADVYLHLGELEQARIIYDQILADSPAGTDGQNALSPALYLNRATIALSQQDPGTALTILNRALFLKSTFSDSDTAMTQLRLLLLEARFGLGEQDEVRKQLDTILASSEESPFQLQAELLKDRLYPEMESMPRLWSLLHRHPDSAALVERLVWVLILQKDFPSAHKALDLYKQKAQDQTDSPWWYWDYLGMLLGLENDLAGALKALEAVPAAWRDYTYYANLAQVQTVLSRAPSQTDKSNLLENALENDSKALDLLPSGTGQAGLLLRSRLLTHRGAVHWALVAYQKSSLKTNAQNQALDDLRKAVQLDPENLRAAFLLRQATSTSTQEKP